MQIVNKSIIYAAARFRTSGSYVELLPRASELHVQVSWNITVQDSPFLTQRIRTVHFKSFPPARIPEFSAGPANMVLEATMIVHVAQALVQSYG